MDGTATVHLSGNLLDDPPPGGDMFGMDGSSEEESEEEAGEPIQEVGWQVFILGLAFLIINTLSFRANILNCEPGCPSGKRKAS